MTFPEAAEITGALLLALGRALLLTLVVELAVAAGAFGLRTRRELAVVALASVATNPALNVLLALAMALSGRTSLADPPLAGVLVLLELGAVFVEWRLIAWALPEHRERALGISVAMNAASLLVGLAILGLS